MSRPAQHLPRTNMDRVLPGAATTEREARRLERTERSTSNETDWADLFDRATD